VGRFLRLFTELPLTEIARIEALQGAEINDAKKLLATEVTRLARGEAAASEAAETARRTFEDGATGDSLPSIDIPGSELGGGLPAFELFRRAGLAASNGEARRLIKGGGARVNDKPVETEMQTYSSSDLVDGVLKLSAGKKRHALVRQI